LIFLLIFVVRTSASDWGPSPKWPILCRAGR